MHVYPFPDPVGYPTLTSAFLSHPSALGGSRSRRDSKPLLPSALQEPAASTPMALDVCLAHSSAGSSPEVVVAMARMACLWVCSPVCCAAHGPLLSY